MVKDVLETISKGDEIVIIVPHAGNKIPPEMKSRINKKEYNPKGHDIYSKKIYSKLKKYGPVILGIPNRELIDYNRKRNHSHPIKGSMPLQGFHGNNFLKTPHTKKQREFFLKKYWDKYDLISKKEVFEQYKKYGKALVVAGHTMEGVGPKNAPDAGKKRPDISIGTFANKFIKKTYSETFISSLRKAGEGLKITVDKPYTGEGTSTDIFGKPKKGLNLLLIEVNIDSYKNWKKRKIIDKAILAATESLVKKFHSKK